MECANNAIKVIMFMLWVSTLAFAQGGTISGSIRQRSTGLGIQMAYITVTEARTHMVAGSGVTDAVGGYSVALPETGDYTLRVARFGDQSILRSGVIALSAAVPDQQVDLSMDVEALMTAAPAAKPQVLSWKTGDGKSYLIPALEIPSFLTLLSVYDRHAYANQTENGVKVYSSTFSSTWNHLSREHWVIDQDPFAVNQLGHPYQGATFHGFARSAGLDYWQALAYDNYGSYLWKMGGETDEPSINDQIATGISGSFFGEVLFRMSSLVLEGDGSDPGFWQILLATALSPSAMINRYAFGDRFKAAFPSNDAATFWRLRMGASAYSDLNDQGVTSTIDRNALSLNFSMAYGLPGQAGYTYSRPFDYFQVEAGGIANAGHMDEEDLYDPRPAPGNGLW